MTTATPACNSTTAGLITAQQRGFCNRGRALGPTNDGAQGMTASSSEGWRGCWEGVLAAV